MNEQEARAMQHEHSLDAWAVGLMGESQVIEVRNTRTYLRRTPVKGAVNAIDIDKQILTLETIEFEKLVRRADMACKQPCLDGYGHLVVTPSHLNYICQPTAEATRTNG